ncbi:MAG: branched-chain amino acid ABC transporter permease, partial [Comamonadaceae bacterium]|nr:branched-chain amino acid ABC transporter permease [Comamonadaceae bacterium]
ELFKSDAVFGAFAKHWLLMLGLTIIASVALLPRGLVGIPETLQQRRRRGTNTRDDEPA